MKCRDCPLCTNDGSYAACGDYDLICLADWKHHSFPDWKDFDFETSGCRRTNKWILSQNPDELLDKYYIFDGDCWEKYMNEVVELKRL